jgi:hypothetical protein
MLGINLKVGVEATLQRLNAHSKGRQFKDLKFVWGYPTAAIREYDGKVTIYLPHVDEAKAVPDGLLHRLVGYVCHELGHYWFTASRVWDKAAGDDKFLHGLINGLEDPRIEKKVINSNFAGNSRNLFEGLVNHVVGAELPTDFDNIPFLLAVEGRRLNGYDILAKQTYQTTPWGSDLEWALTEAHTAPDTKRITEIAIELAKRLREKPKGGEQGEGGEQGGEQGEQGEQGQPGEGEGQPGEQGEQGKQGQPGQPGNEGGEQPGEPGEQGQPGEGKGKGKGKGEGKGRSSDPTDWIGDELAQHQTEAQQEGIVSTIAEPTFYNFN